MEKMGEGDWGPPKPLKKETVKPRGKEAAPVGRLREEAGVGREQRKRGAETRKLSREVPFLCGHRKSQRGFAPGMDGTASAFYKGPFGC